MRSGNRAISVVFGLAVGLGAIVERASAQGSAEDLLSHAAELYTGSQTDPIAMQCARELLSQIIEDHPEAEIAVGIILGEPLGGLDIADIEARAGTIGVEASPLDDLPSDVAALSGSEMASLFAGDFRSAYVDLCVENASDLPGEVAGAMIEEVAAAVVEFDLRDTAATIWHDSVDAMRGIARSQGVNPRLSSAEVVVEPIFEDLTVRVFDGYSDLTNANVDSAQIFELGSPTAQLSVAAATSSEPSAPALLAGSAAVFKARGAALSSHAEDKAFAVVARNLVAADAVRRTGEELRADGRPDHAAKTDALADAVIAAASETSIEVLEGVDGPILAQMLGGVDEVVHPGAAAPQDSDTWGPSITARADLGYSPCRDAASQTPDCLLELGLSDAAIAFSQALDGDYSGTTVATRFRELGPVDLAEAQTIGASVFFTPVLLNGPVGFQPVRMTRNLGATYRDETSARMLGRFPGASAGASLRVSAHRILPDGTQRFAVVETITDGCRACAILGTATRFVEVGPSTGGTLRDRAIGLFLTPPDGGDEITTETLRTEPALLQALLNAQGFEAGQMDGYPGPMTRTALMEFQAAHCLPATGQPDAVTAGALIGASGFDAPCAGERSPEGIGALTPLLSGIYVDDPALCSRESLPFETVNLRQRIIRGTLITWGQEGGCETTRTDIRDGITSFRGTCFEGNAGNEARWRFDVTSNSSFTDLGFDGQQDAPRAFSRCEDDSVLRLAWSAWFAGEAPDDTPAATETADGLMTPGRDTPLRADILAALRPTAEEVYGGPVEFLVDDLRVSADLAFAWVRAQRPGGDPIDITRTPAFLAGNIYLEPGTPEEIQAVLSRGAGGWLALTTVVQPTDAWWLADCAQWGVLFPETCEAPPPSGAVAQSATAPALNVLGGMRPSTQVMPQGTTLGASTDAGASVAGPCSFAAGGINPYNYHRIAGRVAGVGGPLVRAGMGADQRRPVALPDGDPMSALSELTRPSALAHLQSLVGGVRLLPDPGRSRGVQIADCNFNALQAALANVVETDETRLGPADIERVVSLIDTSFGAPSRMETDAIDQDLRRLSLAYDLGLSGIDWQMTLVTRYDHQLSPAAPRVELQTIELAPAPEPSVLPPQFAGSLPLSSFEVTEVVGIFETGNTAEVQFRLGTTGVEASPELLARAEALGLMPQTHLFLVENGERVTDFRRDLGSGVLTAVFRRYDDGWRLWAVR